MSIKTRSDKICKILRMTFPNVKTQLKHKNPFELLVATMLSAQCTDKQVNLVTKQLFKKLKTPYDFVNASNKIIEEMIHSTGFFRNKAKNIKNSSRILIEKYKGNIPESLDELIKLPGIGRKTANVVLSSAFGIPGIAVDTHVARISKRLGLTENIDPVKIEFDLMKIISKKEWSEFSLQLIYFGRAVCKARKPGCDICQLTELCDYS